MTRLSVFGLGYVGAVTSACLADLGVEVIGVDLTPLKVDTINAGRSPIVERGLDELIAAGVASGRLRATADAEAAVLDSDISMICVGTPSNANGSLDLSAVERVAETIGTAIGRKGAWHLVIVRSTMLPGSTEQHVVPLLERHSGLRAGSDFGVCYNPEFLREGSSIEDFHHPPFTIIGSDDQRAAAAAAEPYATLEGEIITTSIRGAEMVKYVCNAFHALKVTFANEVGLIATAHGVDSHEVMDIVGRDHKLNISTAYLRPGFAFGGSCLPKDLRALTHDAKRNDLDVPVLSAILPSNDQHVARAYELVRATGARRVGVLGLSFKAGTDDLRESPLVALVERLIGRGYDVRVHDPNVAYANLHGANRAYIEQEIPHIVSILTETADELLEHSEVVIVGNGDPEHVRTLQRLRDGQHVIDLVRPKGMEPMDPAQYTGIAW
jgi:GDP-mannose 6-dehydrogenase